MKTLRSGLFSQSQFDGLFNHTTLCPQRLIAPLFVVEGSGQRQAIESLPGQFRWSPDTVVDECRRLADAGIAALLLFGQSASKAPDGSAAWDDSGAVQQAVRAIKKALPQLIVMTDVCLCAFTPHGHCRVLKPQAKDPSQWEVNVTLDALSRIAVSHAAAGADVVAPSDKNQDSVGAIRQALNHAKYQKIPLLSYTLKFASVFYGPFRDAVDSSPQFGDRRSYQLDPETSHDFESLVRRDQQLGADAIMVKPALAYLDVLRQIRDQFDLPLAAYQVSGEYAMMYHAAEAKAMDRDRAMLESLRAIDRAGADWVVTYWAAEAAAYFSQS